MEVRETQHELSMSNNLRHGLNFTFGVLLEDEGDILLLLCIDTNSPKDRILEGPTIVFVRKAQLDQSLKGVQVSRIISARILNPDWYKNIHYRGVNSPVYIIEVLLKLEINSYVKEFKVKFDLWETQRDFVINPSQT